MGMPNTLTPALVATKSVEPGFPETRSTTTEGKDTQALKCKQFHYLILAFLFRGFGVLGFWGGA